VFFRRTRELMAAASATENVPAPGKADPRPGAGPRFETDIDPGTLYGVQTIDQALLWMQGSRRVTRREAIAVPAVKRSRDLICSLGQLPLRLHDPTGKPSNEFAPSIVVTPEDRIPSTATWTNVADDLLFEGRALIAVTAKGWHEKPAVGLRVDPSTFSAIPVQRRVRTQSGWGTAMEWPEDNLLIRIQSPNDPLLVAGARAIRALGLLEAAALASADGVPPVDWFEAADALADPFESDEAADEFLDDWRRLRNLRRTGMIPAGLTYKRDGWSPEELQLTSAREIAIAEIARLSGIDAEELGISTTSRTYSNQQDRRKAFLDFTLGPYMRAIESRLSMDDVTPRGWTARFDTTDFLRNDDKTTAETDQILINSKVQTRDEIRNRRGLEPLGDVEEPATEPEKQETPA